MQLRGGIKPQASSTGGRRDLLWSFDWWIVSVAEDCLSPGGCIPPRSRSEARCRSRRPCMSAGRSFSRRSRFRLERRFLPQLQAHQRNHRQHDGDQPEADHDLLLLPSFEVEVVMNRRTKKNTPTLAVLPS